MASDDFKGTHALGKCGCGGFHQSHDEALDDAVDVALIGGLFPDPMLRRQLFKSVGAATLLAALGDLLPIGTLRALAQDRAPLEKPGVTVGFLSRSPAPPRSSWVSSVAPSPSRG